MSNEFDWTEITNKNLKTWGVIVKKQGTLVGTFEFNNTITYIGRMPENHIVLDDPRISRSHAKVTCVGGQYLIEDQQSENGLLVNNLKMAQHWLRLQDKIQIGEFSLEVTDKIDPTLKPQKPASSNLDDRTVNMRELNAPSEATIILTINGQTHMHRIRFGQEDSLRLSKSPSLNVSLLLEAGDLAMKKTLKISNS